MTNLNIIVFTVVSSVKPNRIEAEVFISKLNVDFFGGWGLFDSKEGLRQPLLFLNELVNKTELLFLTISFDADNWSSRNYHLNIKQKYCEFLTFWKNIVLEYGCKLLQRQLIEIDDIGKEMNQSRFPFHLGGVVYSIRKQKIEVVLQNPVDRELRYIDGSPLEKDAHRVDLQEVRFIYLNIKFEV